MMRQTTLTPTRTPVPGSEPLIDPALVPLLQTMLWVSFWIFVILVVRTSRLFSVLVKRIEAGSPVKAGTFELGAPPVLMNPTVQSVTAEGIQGVPVPESTCEVVMDYRHHRTPVVESVYLMHTAAEISPKTAKAAGRYWVRVWLETYEQAEYQVCDRITYRLHDALFKRPMVATEAKGRQFELWLELSGEFTVVAYVERQGKEPLWLTRYLNLPGHPVTVP